MPRNCKMASFRCPLGVTNRQYGAEVSPTASQADPKSSDSATAERQRSTQQMMQVCKYSTYTLIVSSRLHTLIHFLPVNTVLKLPAR